MYKKILSTIILLGFLCTPIFGIEVYLPKDNAGDDINITIEGQTSNTRIRGNEDTLFKTVNLINKYLWRSFTIICSAVAIYGGYQLITANGDKNAMKKAKWAFIGIGIGVGIAMVSYAFVKIFTNLM